MSVEQLSVTILFIVPQDEDRELERLHHSLRASMAVNIATQGAFFERDPRSWAEHLEHILTIILRKKNVQVLERATLRLWKRKIVRHKRRIVLRIVQRMRNRVLSDMWLSWHTHSYEARRQRTKLRRAGTKRKGSLLGGSFQAWRQHAAEQTRTRTVLARVATRIMHNSMLAAWNSWQQQVQESTRHRTLLRRLVVRLIKRGMGPAFHTWRQSASSQRNVKRLLSRVARRLTAKHLVLAIDLWRKRVSESRSMRACFLKVVSRWVKGTVVRSLKAWHECALEARRRRNVTSRILRYMQNRHVAAALLRWTEHTHETSRQRQLLHRVMMRFTTFRLASAWTTWAQHVGAFRQARSKIARAVLRWTQSKKRLAFDTWSARAGDQILLKKQGGRAVLRWANTTLARSFRTWNIVASGEVQKRSLLTKVRGRFLNGKLSMSWETWIDHVRNVRLAEQEELRKIGVRDRVLKRIMYRTVSIAWSQWCNNVHEIRTLRAEEERKELVMLRVVKRMVQRAVASAWECWQAYVQASRQAHAEEERRQASMRRIVLRLSNASLASAFGRWCENVDEIRTLRAEEERKELVMLRVVKRIVHRALSSAWMVWAGHVQSGKRSRFIIKKVSARVTNKGLWQALEAWRSNALEISIRKSKGIKAVMRLANMALACAVEAWHAVTADEQRKRAMCVQIIARIKNRDLSVGWDNWVAFVDQSKFERELMLRALGRSDGLDIALQAQVLLQWSLVRDRRMKSKHLELRHGVRGMHRSLLQWWSICWRNRCKRTVSTCIVMQDASEMLALALGGWLWETQASRRSARRLLKKWMRAWVSFLQKQKLRCALHDAQWRNMAVMDATIENLRRGVMAWRALTSEACSRRARLLQAQARACKARRRVACLGWMHAYFRSKALLRSQRLIARRRFASLSRKSIALWRMTIAWIASLKLSLKTVIQNQIRRLIKRSWVAWHVGDGESQCIAQKWTKILLVCISGLVYDRKTRGKIRAMKWAVCKRCYSDCCKRHFQKLFDGWKETVASYICDYHLRVPAMLGRSDVVVGVGTLYVVKRARRFMAEWVKAVCNCQLHRRRVLKAAQRDRLRQKGVVAQLVYAWDQSSRREKLRRRMLGALVSRRKTRCRRHAMERWWTAVRQRIRGKQIHMKLGIRSAGYVLERFLHCWRACKDNSYNLMQMHALVFHKCGMELGTRVFHEWHARKDFVMQTMYAAWVSISVGLLLTAKDTIPSSKRPRTLASFIVNRKSVVKRALDNKVMSIVVAWHVFTIYQNTTAVLSCQLHQLRSMRIRSCINIWKAARNYRAALNAPLEMMRRGRDSKLSSSTIRTWHSTVAYFKALCNVYSKTANKARHRLEASMFSGWRHVSHSNRVMRLKIKRSAEKCVKLLWVGIRIVWIHWIKVILAERRLLHNRNIARRRSVRAFVRRHFASWRTTMFRKFFSGQYQPQKEIESSSSRLLEGDAQQGYKVWDNDSSETDIDEDNDDDHSHHGQNPSGDSSGSDGDDDFDDKASQASSVPPQSAEASSKPVYISESAKIKSFRNGDGAYSPHVASEGTWRVAGSEKSPKTAMLVPVSSPAVMISASPNSIRFRTSPSPDHVPLSQHAIGWQTWVPQHERSALVSATISRRHNVRALYSIFALWAADTQLALATTHRLSCILSIAQQRILGGGSTEAVCAAAPMLQMKNRARCMTHHWGLWVGVVERRKRLQRFLSMLHSKSAGRRLDTYFMAWQRLQDGEKAKKRKAGSILFHCNETALRLSLLAWRSWNRARRDLLRISAKVSQRMQHCRMRLCFRLWRVDSADKGTVRRKFSSIMLTAAHHVAATHFVAWRHVAHDVACAGRKAQGKNARNTAKHMHKVLTAWYELVSQCKASRRRALRLISGHDYHTLALVCGAWRDQVCRAISLDHTGERVRRRSGRRILMNSFCQWLTLSDDARVKHSRFSTAVDRKFQRCFFLVWRYFMGVTEIKGYSVAVAESRLCRFSRRLFMQRSLFSWHRLVMNGGEARHAVKLARFRRVRRFFQDFRSFMAARALRTRLGRFLAVCLHRRRAGRAVEAWKEALDTRGVPAPYVVRERISDIYLSLSPYPKTFAPRS